ncbi:MAG: hypothetical protein QOJ64_1913 [Acidobacteriota bacterium]|jgi:hypothetical protein|nr:hypothetical protein [Acidobacteriota bacterium]
MQTLLESVTKAQVLAEPFPHLVVSNPLPQELCLRLTSEYPPLDTFTGDAPLASNQRFSLSATRALESNRISPLWREFVQLHTSEAFFSQVIKLFEDHIRLVHPCFETQIGRLDELRSGVRYTDECPRADVLLDAQLCVNTAVAGAPSAVRRAHVDSPNKLFTGLYYLRHPDDTSAGGDLEIARFKGKPRGFKMAEIDDRYVETVKTIKYRPNTLVLFINSIRAVHGVTARSVTPFSRHLFNLVGEVRKPLFDLERYQKNRSRSYLARSVRRMRRMVEPRM